MPTFLNVCIKTRKYGRFRGRPELTLNTIYFIYYIVNALLCCCLPIDSILLVCLYVFGKIFLALLGCSVRNVSYIVNSSFLNVYYHELTTFTFN